MKTINEKQLLENVYSDINDLYLNQDKVSNETINRSLTALCSYLDADLRKIRVKRAKVFKAKKLIKE